MQMWCSSRRRCGASPGADVGESRQVLTTDRSLKCGSSGALWFLHLMGGAVFVGERVFAPLRVQERVCALVRVRVSAFVCARVCDCVYV